MLKYKIRVKGYAAERENFREEVVVTRTFGIQEEVTQSDDRYVSDSEALAKEKVTTSKKKKPVTAFPQDEADIVKVLEEEVPHRLVGLFRQIAPMIRGDTRAWVPPKGRYGITDKLQYWTVDLDNIEIEKVKRSQFLQLHSNFNAKGSTLEYGDSVDFTADLCLWTPALDYDNAMPVVKRIIELSKLKKFGPFRHARISFEG